MSRIVFGLMYLLHALPLSLQAVLGDAAACVLYWIVGERRAVIRTNLARCFPEKSAAERERLARAHWRHFIRSFLDRGMLWWAPAPRLRELVRLEGLEHLPADRPVVVFAPHFVGLDAALSRLSMERPLATIYSRQKDERFDALITRGRTRFGGKVFPRHVGLRKALRATQEGALLYYLPDLDYGPKGAVFVPFFGVPAATVTGLSGIARAIGAAVVPCVTRMLPGGGYRAQLYPAWTDFPSGDDVADARRMLAFVEDRVREMPEQYYWLHKRFKTRPEGEPRFYG
ncbi:MAG TPA: lipid A biosynthesis acyltransferase [Burkholderiales bacterium]|nr:lipid A biosynthesis acyltransferase [Burkholderiales bacterium]